MTAIFIGICFCAPNFIKIGHWMWHGNDIKIAAVCHLGFSIFTVHVTWPFSTCYSASYCKICWNRTSWILKVLIFGHMIIIRFNICLHQISSKSDNFSLRYDDLTIFNMAAVRHLGFLMTSQYCIAGHIFVVQILSWNFMLIGFVV